ncbi:DNA helicase RecQ [Orenia marismortui]|uniref:DNA helicase RecQ n=1 Tax=Orenia marismortui TaxID=46469 RepID=UPI00037CFC8B|nr:DNA helicase RecQ [Orenia marismortui]
MLNQAKNYLEEYFGYDSFRPGQERIIKNILKKENTLGIMPTGGGKSICFQIPALCFSGVTIVISPLISLMKDQIDSLNTLGIPSTFINSSLDWMEIEERIEMSRRGEYKLLYIAPERLNNDDFLWKLKAIDISAVAIDEAHCISSWGHDFRPSYRSIPKLISNLSNNPIITAFTATATTEVIKDISELLDISDQNTFISGFDRPNLTFSLIRGENNRDFIEEYLEVNQEDSGIIYAATRKEVENLTAFLKKKKFKVGQYHAGLSHQERKETQEKFIYDELKIIVATNAFGMGIDKSNVRYVIHHNMPKNLEAYYQEAGRAGRDGEPSECILLFNPADVRLPKFFIDQSKLSPKLKKHEYKKLQDIIDYCYTSKCLRAFILRYFGEEEIVESCDNCSNCNNDNEVIDITIEAQKILSCVYKTEQKVGVSTVADVLRGSKKKKILKSSFNQLSTYGIMDNYKIKEIKDLINILVAEGYIRITKSKYPVTKLTKKSIKVLNKEEKVYHKGRKEIKKINLRNELFDLLDELRTKVAKQEGLPPYIVFQDSTLREMSSKMPLTQKEMLKISGVNFSKFKQYGKEFLNKIQNYRKDSQLKSKNTKTPSHIISYDLYKEGKKVKEISEIRDLAISTVKNHLLKSAEEGLEVEVESFVPKEYRELIMAEIKESEDGKLKPIKDALPEEISYFQIKAMILVEKLKGNLIQK